MYQWFILERSWLIRTFWFVSKRVLFHRFILMRKVFHISKIKSGFNLNNAMHRTFTLAFFVALFTRGGVEDTRLEVKANDTKNFKAKDRLSRGQEHRRKCSPKKKRSSKIFFRRSQKKTFKKLFSGDLYLRKPKKGLCRFSARFLAFSNEISTVQK